LKVLLEKRAEILVYSGRQRMVKSLTLVRPPFFCLGDMRYSGKAMAKRVERLEPRGVTSLADDLKNEHVRRSGFAKRSDTKNGIMLIHRCQTFLSLFKFTLRGTQFLP
jgi:hypothetical protein